MMIGLALFIGTWPYYLAAIAFFAVINWGFCPYEEAKLASTFGQEYLNLKAVYADGCNGLDAKQCVSR